MNPAFIRINTVCMHAWMHGCVCVYVCMYVYMHILGMEILYHNHIKHSLNIFICKML